MITPDCREGVLGLDPRVHLASIVIVGCASIALVLILPLILLQLIAAVYLALNGRIKLAVSCCLSFSASALLCLVPLPGLYGVLFVGLAHLTPPFTVACALFTLSPSAVMCALSRWHVPLFVQVGVCMMVRFVSLLGFEGKQVLRGIRMRGVFARWTDVIFHPALAYECLYAPLVMRCLRLSSELAAAAELRGIQVRGVRSSVHHVGFCWRDVVTLLCLGALCASLVLVPRVLP